MSEKEFILYLEKMNINLTNIQIEQFKKYYELLIEWNNKINLTNITLKEEVYLKHFYDSASILKVIDLNEQENLCDVGTGAGFPGIVLKILYPHLNVTLVDSLNKRIKFLNNLIDELNLYNIETIHSRIEDFAKDNREKYDIVTSRAVAPLNVLLEYCIPIVKEKRHFIAMKGDISQEIIDSKKALNILNSKIIEINQFKLPYEESNRTLLKILKCSKTKVQFPRKNIKIRNRPL